MNLPVPYIVQNFRFGITGDVQSPSHVHFGIGCLAALFICVCLQWHVYVPSVLFDAVGWAAGRASGL